MAADRSLDGNESAAQLLSIQVTLSLNLHSTSGNFYLDHFISVAVLVYNI